LQVTLTTSQVTGCWLVRYLDGSGRLIRELVADARNAVGSIALVADIDSPPRAVTMRELDLDGREVHSAKAAPEFPRIIERWRGPVLLATPRPPFGTSEVVLRVRVRVTNGPRVQPQGSRRANIGQCPLSVEGSLLHTLECFSGMDLEMNPFVGHAKPRIFVIRPALFKSTLVYRVLPLTFHSGPRRRGVAVACC
jgi:hypothetical protein